MLIQDYMEQLQVSPSVATQGNKERERERELEREKSRTQLGGLNQNQRFTRSYVYNVCES